MAKYLHNKIIYTADDEEPDCMRCDNCVCCDDGENCGSEYGWGRYKRTEFKKGSPYEVPYEETHRGLNEDEFYNIGGYI